MDDRKLQTKPTGLFAASAYQPKRIYERDVELEAAILGGTLATICGLRR
jgi:hypothetical protein